MSQGNLNTLQMYKTTSLKNVMARSIDLKRAESITLKSKRTVHKYCTLFDEVVSQDMQVNNSKITIWLN